MADNVKFIFKSLIKVPIFIFVAFFIFNIFTFFFIYFKMLGISYVVMQTAVENNYLPQQELTTLNKYMTSLNKISYVENAHIVVDNDTSGATLYNGSGNYLDENGNAKALKSDGHNSVTRRQYGNYIVTGVYCKYRIIWPLQYVETMHDTTAGVAGMNNGNHNTVETSNTTLANRRSDSKHAVLIPIKLVYTIPGLKYYPDLGVDYTNNVFDIDENPDIKDDDINNGNWDDIDDGYDDDDGDYVDKDPSGDEDYDGEMPGGDAGDGSGDGDFGDGDDGSDFGDGDDDFGDGDEDFGDGDFGDGDDGDDFGDGDDDDFGDDFGDGDDGDDGGDFGDLDDSDFE